VLHHHRHEKMGFEHSHPGAEGVVKPVTPAFDPEHYPNDGEIEKENDVRDFAISKGNGDDGGATGDGPVGRNVEPLPPDHDAPELATIEMRHGIDVAGVIKAALQRNRCFVSRGGRGFFCCHGSSINWITASPQYSNSSRTGKVRSLRAPGVAHASRVLAKASRLRGLIWKRLFRRDAETNTRDACA